MKARTVPACTLGLLAAMLGAAAAASAADWPVATDLAAVMTAAEQKGTPVAVLYMNRTSGFGWWQGRTKVFENARDLQSMTGVRMYTDQQDAKFEEIRRNIEGSWAPMLVILDGDGRVIGFCGNDSGLTSRDIADQAAQAWSVFKWEKASDELLKQIEPKLKQRRYAEVETTLNRIEDQDRKTSQKLKAKVPWLPARESWLSRDARRRREAEGRETEESKKRDQEAAKEREARNAQWFFYEEIPQYRDKLKAAISKEIDDAKELLAGGNPKEAQMVLRTILFYKADEGIAKQMEELRLRIEQAIAEEMTKAKPFEGPKAEEAKDVSPEPPGVPQEQAGTGS